jgi:hypothetical protein
MEQNIGGQEDRGRNGGPNKRGKDRRIRITIDDEMEAAIEDKIANERTFGMAISRVQAAEYYVRIGIRSCRGGTKIPATEISKSEQLAEVVKPVDTVPPKLTRIDDPLLRIIKSQERNPWAIVKPKDI